jgi:hypothetical protein
MTLIVRRLRLQPQERKIVESYMKSMRMETHFSLERSSIVPITSISKVGLTAYGFSVFGSIQQGLRFYFANMGNIILLC